MGLFKPKQKIPTQEAQVEVKEAEEMQQPEQPKEEVQQNEEAFEETAEEQVDGHQVLLNHEQRLQALESALFRIKGAI